MSGLHVPDLDVDDSLEEAAQRYAAAGWFVGPIRQGVKHAGSVLGKGWPTKTSRHPEQLRAWFDGFDDERGLFLHCGRSGAVAFDIDDPAQVPAVLAMHLAAAPHQSTRAGVPGRGHYLFAVPPGRSFGNGNGGLGGAWGEVRGANGIVVAAPTRHEKAHIGGRYLWLTTGAVPVLPAVLADQLRDVRTTDSTASDADVEAFLGQHRDSVRPGLLRAVMARWRREYSAGSSRHQTALGCLVWALKEARAGYYPARIAADQIRGVFLSAMAVTRPRHPTERTADGSTAQAEFDGLLAHAVAQATDPSLDLREVRRRAELAGMPRPPKEGTDRD